MKKCMMILLFVCILSLPVSADITHRYSFTADPNDSIGGADGSLVNGAVITEDGQAEFFGGDDATGAYVNLPAAAIGINAYPEITMELWSSSTTNNPFGMTAAFGGTWPTEGTGQDYIFITTDQGTDISRAAIANTPDGTEPWNDEVGVNGPAYFDGTEHHYVMTVTDTTLAFYIDGELQNTATMGDTTISGLSTDYGYLGKGVYSIDATWAGLINEFRLYDAAVSDLAIFFNGQLGPDLYQDTVLLSMSPANGSVDVPYNPTAELEWTADAGITVDHFEIYLTTDPNIIDPNLAITVGAGTPYDTTTDLFYDASGLSPTTEYGWRIDAIESGTGTRYVGPAYTFITAPPGPVFLAPLIQHTAAFPGESASFTVNVQSEVVPTIQWFKVSSPDDVEITESDPNVTIVTDTVGEITTSTLTIANVDTADEGDYYAKAASPGGEKDSQTAQFVIKKLLAWYAFEDNADDSSGNGLDGTVMNGPVSYVSGQVGQAVNLDGFDDYIDLPDGFANFLSGLTFNVWAYPDSAANWARFLTFNNGAPSDNIFFTRIGTGTTLRFDVERGTINVGVVDAPGAIALNEWQMFTVTMSETGAVTLYKNGLPIATGTVQIPNLITRTQCWIGESAWSGDSTFNGWLDEIRIYNYALTADAVADQYVADTGAPFCRNAPAYDLDDDCRVTLSDFAIIASTWLECGSYPADSCPVIE